MQEKISNPDSDDGSEIWKTWTPREYLSNMLHELRTPIMIIKGYAAILADEKQKDIHPKAIEAISYATERLELLWNDMATYNGKLMRRSDT